MKVLVTGANGQLGYDVVKRLDTEGVEHIGTDRYILDLTNEEQVKRVISDYSPDVVIHCAAYTAVDKAEDEKELCHAVNVSGTKYVAEVCREIGAKMVYISTDYVFDGELGQSYEVTHKPNPINYYGKTKYEGEIEVQKYLDKYFIVRISWVFGNHGNNFVKTMLRISEEKSELSVVDDQFGSPTYTYDIAKVIVEMIKTEKYGIYHATNEGYCSWYEFACEIFRQVGMNINVNPIKTEDYPTKAKRPKNSRLYKNLSLELQNWKSALSHYIEFMKRD